MKRLETLLLAYGPSADCVRLFEVELLLLIAIVLQLLIVYYCIAHLLGLRNHSMQQRLNLLERFKQEVHLLKH